MSPTQARFSLNERKNVYAKGGKEWAFFATLEGEDKWVIQTWDNKPTKEVIAQLKKTVIRSFEIYHRNLRIPQFQIEEI